MIYSENKAIGDIAMAALDSVSSSQQGEEVDCMNKLFGKACNLGEEGLDWISELPDELLVNIISHLTFAEAFRTSVLSSRWINLWKSAVSVLDFDASNELRAIRKLLPTKAARRLPGKRRKYMNWVNRVVSEIQQSGCPKLTKFRLAFNLTNECNSEGDIDRWVKFAISKRVESLHLYLDAHITKSLVFSEECYNHVKSPVGLCDIRFLRSLRLTYVQISGEILEHFVANCPVLEELVVTWSFSLTRLKVVGSSSLKHLEVRGCNLLESVEIGCAPRLERFIFGGGGRLREIRVGNCPSLVDITLVESCIRNATFRALSGCASRLVSLYLRSGSFWEPISGAAEHSNLERLTMQVSGGDCASSILVLVPLINVCPRLHTLRLFLDTHYSEDFRGRPWVEVVKVCRDSIKVVEVVGFRGYEMEYEFMEYVLEYFVGLERIVIDWSATSFPNEDSTCLNATVSMPRCSEDQLCEAEKRALELKSRAPSTIEFLVI